MRGMKHRDTRLLALIWLEAALLVQALFAPVHLSAPIASEFDQADPVQVAYAAMSRICNPAGDDTSPDTNADCALCSAALSPTLLSQTSELSDLVAQARLEYARAQHQTRARLSARTLRTRAPPKTV